MTSATLNSQPSTVNGLSEDQLVETAKAALSGCNWTIGECASAWTKRFARGRSDAAFAEMLGLSADQVYQRRRVCETFADVREEYPKLKWSHFLVALTWDDSPECLAWANEMEATVAEMRAWRRAQHGEDLESRESEDDSLENELASTIDARNALAKAPSPPAPLPEVEGSQESRREYNPVTRQDVASGTKGRESKREDTPYSPYGTGARSTRTEEPRGSTASESIVRRVVATLEKCDQALTPELLEDLPGELLGRLHRAIDALAAKAGR